ncbi:MAG: zf-HC2 domain-containing protein [Anaerolineales bacterium]
MTERAHTPACESLLDQLSDYVDGELDPEICRLIESHLKDCTDCQVLVDTTQRTVRLSRQLGDDPTLPPAVADRLWQAIDESCRG